MGGGRGLHRCLLFEDEQFKFLLWLMIFITILLKSKLTFDICIAWKLKFTFNCLHKNQCFEGHAEGNFQHFIHKDNNKFPFI